MTKNNVEVMIEKTWCSNKIKSWSKIWSKKTKIDVNRTITLQHTKDFQMIKSMLISIKKYAQIRMFCKWKFFDVFEMFEKRLC